MTLPPPACEGSRFSASLPAFGVAAFFYFSHSDTWYLIAVLFLLTF